MNESNGKLEEIGENLRRIRVSKGLTQKQVSDATEITQPCLSEIERGKRPSSVLNILKLIEFYNADYEEIFGSIEKKPLKAVDEKELTAFSLMKDFLSEADNGELSQGGDIFLKLCIYYFIRRLYRINPHNTDVPFKIPAEESEKKIREIFDETPSQLSAYAEHGRIRKNMLEPKAENSRLFRQFIEECEEIIGVTDKRVK